MEIIRARGHPNITALHKTTLEITRDQTLSLRGDCIVGIKAEKGIRDISEDLKRWLKSGKRVRIELTIPEYNMTEVIHAQGHRDLEFTHSSDIVIRKSDFVCGRTLAIKADKSARDLDRKFVSLLKNEETVLQIKIIPDESS